MTTRSHDLMRIFWPSDAPRDNIPSVLLGWRNSEHDVLVVSVLQGVDVGCRETWEDSLSPFD